MQRFDHTDIRSLMFSKQLKWMFSLLDMLLQVMCESFVPLNLPIHIFFIVNRAFPVVVCSQSCK